jgi:hypothetical protein
MTQADPDSAFSLTAGDYLVDSRVKDPDQVCVNPTYCSARHKSPRSPRGSRNRVFGIWQGPGSTPGGENEPCARARAESGWRRLERRYIWRVAPAQKWAFADYDTVNVRQIGTRQLAPVSVSVI